MCHMRRRRIHVSYEEEEATCVGTQGTKHSTELMTWCMYIHDSSWYMCHMRRRRIHVSAHRAQSTLRN